MAITSATGATSTSAPKKAERLLSIDALRGFDMLLISGGGTFLVLLEGKTGRKWVDWVAGQLVHPAWNGFTFFDFIFPLFLFTAGVSLSFSLKSRAALAGTNKAQLYGKALRRALILIFLGILDKNAPLDLFDPSSIRYGSVLGRIGIATFVTTVLYMNLAPRMRVITAASILAAYWAALTLIPVPGYGAGDLTLEGNLAGWIDRTIMPGRLLQKTYDELGILTQFPALCLTIFGSVAGDLLQNHDPRMRRIVALIFAGACSIAIAWIWSFVFPVNKHLWSSSYILLTTGMSFIFLSVFYGIIDVAGYRKWAFFFKVIGMNSLVIYLGYRFIDFGYTSRMLFEGLYRHTDEKWHEPLNAFGAVLVVWSFLYILYRNRIFVKI